MTIDPLGTLSAARPERGYTVQGTLPSTTGRTPAATQTATTNPATAPAAPAETTTMPAAGDPAEELKDAVSKLNASVHAQSIEFSIDEDSKRTIVKVIDTATKEVVRQMPTEEALQIAKALDKAFGLLIHQQA